MVGKKEHAFGIVEALMGKEPTVLVVGDLMLDRYLWGECERISAEAPVQVVDVRSQATKLGGAGNVADNLGALGARVRIASVTGEGEGRDELIGLLEGTGASTDGVRFDPARRVTQKTRLMAAHQQVVRCDHETRSPLSPAMEALLIEAVADQIDGVDVVVVSDYGKGVCTPTVTIRTIELARQRGVPVLCDPKGTDYAHYAGATAVTPNRKEASEATRIQIQDEASLERAGQQLREDLSLRFCLVTLGADGMALFEDEGIQRIPTVAREVFDVTGAGDTVIATLAYALGAGADVAQACELANLAAGVVVGKIGSATASPDELREHAATFRPQRRITDKVVELRQLEAIVADLRARGRRIVFTNGCFDILHAGHIKVLEDTAALGDVLVIGLNSDASVQRIKGPQRPVNGEADRAYLLSALSWVDFVVLFDEDTPLQLIRRLTPDVLAKGGDYIVETIVGSDIVLANGGDVVTVPLVPGKSTTALIERIGELSAEGEQE